MPQSTFKFFVPFTKAYIQKDTNKMVVEGLASTTEVDLTGEKMAESAIKSMAASNLPLPFRSEHRGDWDSELGKVTSLSATPDHQLLMKAELDADHPNAHFLFGKLQTGSQLGLSIGGQVNDWAWENDPEIGKTVRTYKDIALKEVSVTSHPAVQSTFLSAISKSLNTEEPSMQKTQDAQAAPATVDLEPADAVITDPTNAAIPEGSPQDPAVNGDVPLNPDQPAPADQPAAAPATPATPGDHATEEQVEALEDKPAETQADTATPEQPDDQAPATPDDAGHQEAASTEATQPDAATTETADEQAVTPNTEAEETHKALQDERDTLQKSLSDVSDELVTIKKQLAERSITLSEKEAAVTKATEELTAIKSELETTQKALTDTQTQAETEKSRKAYAVASKFDEALNFSQKNTAKDLDKAFADFFITGQK